MRLYSKGMILALLVLSSCLNLEEEPILLVQPEAVISAHIKNQKVYATALINVNPQVLTAGNLPTNFEFSGELSIHDTNNGNVIDVNTFSGGGLSQVYSVSADTLARDRVVVIASGTVNAYADIGNDSDSSNDKLIATGEFYSEANLIIEDLLEN